MNIFINILLGLSLGSFLNVIVGRMGRGESLVKGRSKCESCGTQLKWYELIPVISFVILRGRCKSCKAKINISHLSSELILGIGFGVVGYLIPGYNITQIAVLYITVLSIGICAISDFQTKYIYPIFAYIGVSTIVLLEIPMVEGNESLFVYVLTLSTAVVIIYALSSICKDFVGEGDFDILFLLFVSGGLTTLLYTVFYGSLIGILWFAPKIYKDKAMLKTRIAFVPLMYFGYLINLII